MKSHDTEDTDSDIENHNTCIFKMAAKSMLDRAAYDNVSEQAQIKAAVKYGILTKHTAFVGIKKNRHQKDHGVVEKVEMPTISNFKVE